MEDKDFLHSALQQAFLHPVINPAYGAVLIDNAQISRSFVFKDSQHKNLLVYALPLAHAKKQISLLAHDIKNSKILMQQYQIFKHDIAENIVVPDDFEGITEMKNRYDLLSVSRQAAQKKKVVAALLPADFTLSLKKAQSVFNSHMQKTQQLLLANPLAEGASLLNDFAAQYLLLMKKAESFNPLFWLNKKRLIYYLNEAAQIMKSHHPLPAEFCDNHTFWGEKNLKKNSHVIQYKHEFCQMISMLQKMSHVPELLSLVQALLVGKSFYLEQFNKYRKDHNIQNINKISSLRHQVQKLFQKYVVLVYLDGVRFAFENQFLNECPEPRHPQLPTVSPIDECKKIIKIIEESYKINDENGKIRQFYQQSLRNFYDTAQEIADLLK